MAEEYNIERLNFLVVDDNKHMTMMVKSLIHALGSRNVREANDAAEAFSELKHFEADIIITDFNMQPLDGLDFVRLVRTGSDSLNPYIPIIMLSGHTEMNRILEARDAGVTEYLAKPISATSLYSRIRKIIMEPRPFVKAGHYFGPDRRRNNASRYNGKDRRKNGELEEAPAEMPKAAEAAPAAAAAAAAEDAGGMDQSAVDSLFD